MILRQHSHSKSRRSCSTATAGELTCTRLFLGLLAGTALLSPASSPRLSSIGVQAAAVDVHQHAAGQQLTFQAPNHLHQDSNDPPSSSDDPEPSTSTSTFSLTHAIHLGGDRYPGLKAHHSFKPGSYNQLYLDPDITADTTSAFSVKDDRLCTYGLSEMQVKSVKQKIWRPSHPAGSEVYEAARRKKLYKNNAKIQELADQLRWDEVEIDAPDVSDVNTLATLAKMSSNAYSTPDSGWYDVSNDTLSDGRKYNLSSSFGWKEDGLRGHIFSSGPNNESIIIALKGTSSFIGGGETGRNDKLNDNLLFSCCCARVDWTWTPVCDCFAGRGEDPPSNDTTAALPSPTSSFEDQVYVNRCNLTCLEDALIEKSVYFPLATDLFNNITYMYPQSRIWLTGHSLGGSLAALLATTFGVPCVTFEAPGDQLAAKRLHLPLPPGSNWDDKRPDFGITHVYTNSDPIPQGVCTGAFSTCGLVGFALESKCHTGQTIIYDAVGKLGWSVDIRTHRIGTIIERLLIPDWDRDGGAASSTDVSTETKIIQQAPVFVSQDHSWFSWGWPWPRKGKRHEDESPPSDGPDEGNGDRNDDQPEEPPVEPTKPPKNKEPRSHVPKPQINSECRDCFKWEFFDDFGGKGL
ncbi:alpha/beta-hydrolase [Cystobasidium minutum MCA 4210]|uniref:alpha/beta-hydrolase n=1 Tax=Cystobasidium minutum MCA 4210 TaxID=1397322 RepID=UPI0034CD901F|eukprot:jgi/Rhomi1/19319/CE19318_756